jgi:hypothetical protein
MTERYEAVVPGMYGMFRDVVRDARGRVQLDSGWVKNAIVVDCRRVIAGLLRGSPTSALSIQGLRVGAGLGAWDALPAPPAPSPTQSTLEDANSHLVPRAELDFQYLEPDGSISAAPTNRLQIVAELGPGVPPWPDASHASATLREFGLVAQLEGTEVLLNYRTHAAIPKDPASTLTRTIWLVF